MLLAQLSAVFQSLRLLPACKLGTSRADSRVVGLCTFQDPVGLSKELSCVAGSFPCCYNPQIFLQPEVLRLYFLPGPCVVQSVSLPSCSSQFICMRMWDHAVYQPLPCLESSPPWLLCSTPTTSMDECFFFNSLVVRLPYSWIFWQFWLFFCFYISCCPSFGCVRRQSVSPYTSILARDNYYSHYCRWRILKKNLKMKNLLIKSLIITNLQRKGFELMQINSKAVLKINQKDRQWHINENP